MNQNTTTRIDFSGAALWASAFVITALVIVQAGRLPGSTAHADMTAILGDYTLMTADSGRGGDEDPDELLYVIDSRDGTLLVYDIEDVRQKRIVLRDGGNLDRLFSIARGG